MRTACLSFLLAWWLLGAACSNSPFPVPVSGDLDALRGEWQGEYHSPQSGRSGNIVFRLEAGHDTAHGDVMMVPAETGPVEPSSTQEMARARAIPLTIAFVRTSAGHISGRLDPYRDPACGCLLVTIFLGTQVADTFSGTFVSYHEEMGERMEGTWRAVRIRRNE